MTDQQTRDTKSEKAHQNTDGQASEKLPKDIPECCRHMMSRMTSGSCWDLLEKGEEPSPQNRSASPGILGRLMLTMMRACCGRLAPNQKSAD